MSTDVALALALLRDDTGRPSWMQARTWLNGRVRPDDGATMTLVLETADGLGLGFTMVDHHDEARSELSFWTHPQHRRQGLGSAMLAMALDAILTAGDPSPCVHAWVLPANRASIGVLDSVGARAVGVRPDGATEFHVRGEGGC